MINSLLTDTTTRALESALSFTEQRHEVILSDIANVSVPGYVQKDASVDAFQQSLRDAIDRQNTSPGKYVPWNPASSETVQFIDDDGTSAVRLTPENTLQSPVFHDHGVRSMESLMSNLADNAIAHNMVAQMLKFKYNMTASAIAMRV